MYDLTFHCTVSIIPLYKTLFLEKEGFSVSMCSRTIASMSMESQPKRRGMIMMKTVLLIGFAISFSANVQAAPSVLVYHDVADGYGDAVLEAIDELWPSCIPDVYTGTAGQNGFNAALSSGSWDAVVIECWCSDLNGIDWLQILDMYNNGDAAFFIYCFNWIGPDGLLDLAHAMGIQAWSPSYYIQLMEVLDYLHPLVQGISDWQQYYVESIMIQRVALIHSDAYPVTGWKYGSDYVDGICVAPNRRSIISGFCPAYAVEGVAIWKNILSYLCDEGSLNSNTWGGIKACF